MFIPGRWPPDGTGHSIVLANPTYGEGDPRAWDISDVVGGSPGQMDGFTPSPLRNVVINEILPHSENPAVPQFIELYNHSTNSVDVSGCILTDDPTTNKFVIPSGTVIGPAGFVSFTQPQFGFTLNGAGETLYFIKPDGSRVLDAVQFGAQADGVSYGRWPDGANDFYAFTTNTPGTNNSSILIGDIVINELMYDPISGNDDDQYIELYNKGTNTVNLAGWQFTPASPSPFRTSPSRQTAIWWSRQEHDQFVRQISESEQRQHGRQLQRQAVARRRTGAIVHAADAMSRTPFTWPKTGDLRHGRTLGRMVRRRRQQSGID
jgi:hypothetical protein